MKSSPQRIRNALLVLILSILGGSDGVCQECLPRSTAIIDAGGGYFKDGGDNVIGEGWLGMPIGGLFPVPEDLNGDGISDVCEAEAIANVGDEIPRPIEADPAAAPEIHGATTKVYWHDVEKKMFANELGQVELWWPSGGGPIKKKYEIKNETPTVYFFLSDGAGNDGPPVDLSPQTVHGSPRAIANVRYNSTITLTPNPPYPPDADAWVDEVLNVFRAKKAGTVVLEYNDSNTGALLGYEVIRLRQLTDDNTATVDVGTELIPALADTVIPDPTDTVDDCIPLVQVGDGVYAWQQKEAQPGPTRWNVYAIRPTPQGSINSILIYWYKKSQDVCWPNERRLYSAVWPTDPQINVRGEGGPAVDMTTHKAAEIKYQNPPTHANLTARQFTTTTPGMATVMYTDDAPDASGEEVSFEVVKTVDHHDGAMGFPFTTDWDIGDHLTDPEHDTTCNDGFLFSGTYYDPDTNVYDPSTLTGRVFAVNVGDIEMWWYETSQLVCWPVKPVVYSCDWPDMPDRCIIISNEEGSGPFPPSKWTNPSIYALGTLDSDPNEIGHNPNEEHAEWNTNPGDSILAARDDLNAVHGRSEPYVLVRYQDVDQSGAWEFDVIRVTREVQPGFPVAGCPCDDEVNGPCTLNYSRIAGQPMRPPLPLGLEMTLCPEDTIITEPTPEYIWDDDRGGLWFIRGGAGVAGTVDVIARFYERWEAECTPWLDDGSGIPINVTYQIAWPQIPSSTLVEPMSGPDVYTTMEAGRTRDRSGFKQAEILYNEAGASLIMPWKPSYAPLSFSSFPDDYQAFYAKLPPHIRARLSYDSFTEQLQFRGVESEGLLGIMSENDRNTILETFYRPEHSAFRGAVNNLHIATQQPGVSAVGYVLVPDSPDWGIAISSGSAHSTGWMVVGYNGRSDITEPALVEVLRVVCPPHKGEIHVVYPDCPFDEQITLRWSGDCAGDCKDVEFYWQVAAGDNPDDYDDVDPNEVPTNPFNPWEDYVDPERGYASGYVLGQNEIIIRGANVRTLTDNWFRVRTRGYDTVCGMLTESEWTDAQLAEGWIKRVKRGLNPFDQRVKDFTNARVATYVSMLEQLGNPYQDVIAFSCTPDYINDLGLIEAYQAVLFRGRSFTIDLGVQYPPANQALILMAGSVADFYMLLGNEAHGDALDPTIGIDVDVNEAASAMFCFQDQLPTNQNSLLYEELALLRGRDDRGTAINQFPVYHRLYWNFTMGDGQVAYVNNYNIQDKDGDGFQTADDAAIMFPQGHGDAWGHYLTALKFYYELLRHPDFDWPIRSEYVLVNQVPVEVSFAHERKFARAASAKAKCGVEVLDLTYREQYLDDPSTQWKGYKDPVPERHWGVMDWGRRTHMGAHFDWLTANSVLPATDDDPTHEGTVRKVDRTTVAELREIASLADSVQARIDEADAGLNPLGLAKNVVPFDISPSEIANNKTHFEQIYERAVGALNNSIVVFNHANELANSLRRHQDEVGEFQNNIEDREADFNNRLIEVFGYPFPEDRDPISGNIYTIDFHGPDLYHWAYVDADELLGFELPQADVIRVTFDQPVVDPTTGVLSYVPTNPVEFNVVPGLGLIKPRNFTLPRKAPGEIQLARSELLQAYARFDRALTQYDLALADIEDTAYLLESFYAISREEISILNTKRNEIQSLNEQILGFRIAQLGSRLAGRVAMHIAEAGAEALPKNFVAGVASGGDMTSVPRSAIRNTGIAISEVLNTAADAMSVAELRATQCKEELSESTQIQLQMLRQVQQAQAEVMKLEQMIRNLIGLETEMYSLQEALRQASGRYLAAIQRGVRLLEDRTRFRRQTAAQISDYRYKDMAFRIFRNDALQKYRAQFDLAARYVYLAAKAYDYETNLLSADSQGGEQFFSNIVRERTIGQISGGLPIVGRGLGDILARLSQNFTVLKGQLGFNNPQTETTRFSLRQELFRTQAGLSSNEIWQQTLDRHIVADLRDHEEFVKLCDPLRVIVNSPDPEPGLVIPFETTITLGMNYFGWPLSGGDSSYSTTNFATKVRTVGVWFSNYNATASAYGLTFTPRVYLVPAGADVMRVPTVNIGRPREWFLVDQVLSVPFPLNAIDLENNRDWLPGLGNFGGSSDYGRPRRFGDFRAYHDSGSFNEDEVISDSRLIGRSVWNTRWLLILPGSNLLANPEDGLQRFIYGSGVPGEGVTDIKIFFQTYAYSSG